MAEHKSTVKKGEEVSVNLSGVSLAAMIVGIIAVVTFWIPFWGFLIGAAALVLGIIGLAKHAPHKGWALAGTILGGAAVFLSILAFVFLVALSIYNSNNDNTSSDYYNDGSSYQSGPFAN